MSRIGPGGVLTTKAQTTLLNFPTHGHWAGSKKGPTLLKKTRTNQKPAHNTIDHRSLGLRVLWPYGHTKLCLWALHTCQNLFFFIAATEPHKKDTSKTADARNVRSRCIEVSCATHACNIFMACTQTAGQTPILVVSIRTHQRSCVIQRIARCVTFANAHATIISKKKHRLTVGHDLPILPQTQSHGRCRH